MQITKTTMKDIKNLLPWFKPGHTVYDLINLHDEGHIDLAVMIENERSNA